MYQSGPLPWMGGPGPFGPPTSGSPNQWEPQGAEIPPPPFCGFSNVPPPNDGSMPPWMSNPDGSNIMGMGASGGSSGNNMYGGSNPNSGGNYYNQPPPPPPSSAPQPPSLPSSGMGNPPPPPQWQQQWGGEQKDRNDESGGASNVSTSRSNSYAGKCQFISIITMCN